jgi:ribosomal protein L24E
MTPGTQEYQKLEAATSDEDRRLLVALRLLAHANALPVGASAAKDLYDAARLLIPDYPAPQSVFSEVKFLADPKKVAWLYAALLNDKISKSRLLISRRRGEPFLPSIVCPDIPTAAFVFASYGGVEVCPGCGKLFAPSPERSQLYCSENCGQRIYQRRYRRRQKSRLPP